MAKTNVWYATVLNLSDFSESATRNSKSMSGMK